MKIETDGMAEELCENESEQNESEQETVKMEGAFTPKESSFQAVVQNKTEKKLGYPKKKQTMTMNKLKAIKERKNGARDPPNEEEYFDDSTEERFYNQSSDSDSDSSDDFFIGKVKRKKKVAAVADLSSSKKKDKLQKNIVKEEKNTAARTVQDVIMEEGKQGAKANKLESMFCSSLSNSNQKSQNRR